MCSSEKCNKNFTKKNTTNMSVEKHPSISINVEKQEAKNFHCEDNDEPLEKSEEKTPPGINASLVLLYIFFLTLFAIGWVNLNNCSISKLIPIYLIVVGLLGVAIKFLSRTTNRHLFNINIILVVAYFTWHGLGSYWVYKEYQPNYNYKLGKYCDRTTFLIAFWTLTLQYTVVTFLIVLFGCYHIMSSDFRNK